MSKLPDPRTIIAALVIVSTTIYSAYSAYSPWFVCTLGGFAAVMLASAAINPNTLVRPSWVAVYLATFAALGPLVFVIPLVWKSTASAVLVLFLQWMWRFSVSAGMGAYAIGVIRPATLQKALASSRIPTCFTIPISVALRVLPVIGHEVKAISDAMKLRGMSALSLRSAQYFTIPLLSTVVRSGDELASAALVRGLGGTAKPTSVTVVKFRVVDAVILLIVIGFAIWRIVL